MRFRKDLGDLSDLKKSILEVGQLHPCIFTKEGKLISGARRLQACKELNIEPLTRVIDFKNPDQREQAEIQENTIRKDFFPSEIFDIYQYYFLKLSKQGQRGLHTESVRSETPIEVIARLTGRNKDTISKINNIFNYGSEDIKRRVDAGKLSINEADNLIKKDNRIQNKIDRLKEYSKTFKSTDIQIVYKDFYEYSKEIPENSVDLVLTDPPYGREYIDLWAKLFEVSYRVLKPSKYLICYCGQQNIDKVFQLKNDLIYYWMFRLNFKVQFMVKPRNIIADWKPCIIWQKPPFKKLELSIHDTIIEKDFVYNDRTLHADNWQQGIEGFLYLIEKFTDAGDLIFDPMTGTGTTLVACQRLKRRCIGAEIDRQYKPIIEGRLSVNE